MQKYSGKQWCRDISEIVHTGSAVFADSTGGVEVSRVVSRGCRGVEVSRFLDTLTFPDHGASVEVSRVASRVRRGCVEGASRVRRGQGSGKDGLGAQASTCLRKEKFPLLLIP